MTSVRDAWLRREERKRNITSVSIAALLYALLLAGIMLSNLFSVKEFTDFSGPIVVRLGKPEGVDEVRVDAPTEEIVIPEPDAPTPEIAEPAQVSVPSPTVTMPAKMVPAPDPAKPKPAAPKVDPIAQPSTGAGNLVLKGSEAGNSYDISVMGSPDSVRRGGYVPINLFMPLPFTVSDAIYARIPDLSGLSGTAAMRKKEFEAAYLRQGNSWQLKNSKQPDFSLRPTLWIILEDAGFDTESADYKNGKNLRPVTLRFKVAAYSAGKGAQLQQVTIMPGSGSGYSDIDEAVLYGFQRAQFSNTGKIAIEGSFTYRF